MATRAWCSWCAIIWRCALTPGSHLCARAQLTRAVGAWEPREERVPLHAWLHPWLEALGRQLEDLYPTIRFKLAAALQAWHPSDASALALLSPWHTVRAIPREAERAHPVILCSARGTFSAGYSTPGAHVLGCAPDGQEQSCRRWCCVAAILVLQKACLHRSGYASNMRFPCHPARHVHQQGLAQVFEAKEWAALIGRSILPKLAYTLDAEFAVNPVAQELQPWHWVSIFCCLHSSLRANGFLSPRCAPQSQRQPLYGCLYEIPRQPQAREQHCCSWMSRVAALPSKGFMAAALRYFHAHLQHSWKRGSHAAVLNCYKLSWNTMHHTRGTARRAGDVVGGRAATAAAGVAAGGPLLPQVARCAAALARARARLRRGHRLVPRLEGAPLAQTLTLTYMLSFSVLSLSKGPSPAQGLLTGWQYSSIEVEHVKVIMGPIFQCRPRRRRARTAGGAPEVAAVVCQPLGSQHCCCRQNRLDSVFKTHRPACRACCRRRRRTTSACARTSTAR